MLRRAQSDPPAATTARLRTSPGLLGPQPRYRIYTTAGSYLTVLGDYLLGRVCRGDAVERFERAVAGRHGGVHACAISRARTGIHFALKALIQPGQKVVLSPYTIADVINMVICAGGVPVFADVERDTCNIDPAEIERLIDDNTGAVMVTHLHGLACDMPRIAEICRRRGVPLVEDAAQAFEAKIGGRRVGTFGDAGIFSFGMYKHLNSFNGGMVITRDADLCERIRCEVQAFPCESRAAYAKRVVAGLVRDVATHPLLFRTLVGRVIRFGHCRNIRAINKFVTSELDLSRKDQMPAAYLKRLTATQARLALKQLGRVEADTEARIRAAAMYRDGLAGLEELILPRKVPHGAHVYTYFPIQYRDRPALYDWMIRSGRDVGIQHLKNCADLPSFEEFYRDCPRARAAAASVLLLPTYPRYPERDIQRNIDCIRAFFDSH